MALLEILKFPDPRLREVSQPIQEFNSDLEKNAKDMLETMYKAHGIGLAAPQVGLLKRLLVIDTRSQDEKGRRYQYDEMTSLEIEIQQPLIICNPEIVDRRGKITFDEGCLSVPSFYETVERSEFIELKYFDLKGKEQSLKVDGLLSICIQHEIDHLEGTLFIDRLSFIKSNKIKNQIKKNGYSKRENESEDQDSSPRKKDRI